jgi:beta-glucosidase/6-phospho-beta-glucosidase/beta-galactosidase
LAGFECSTHKRQDGTRLDLIASTHHDTHARADYERLRSVGIRAARDGVRWHLIERSPGHYDFSSLLPMLQAARQTGTQVIWDLCHYGWPDGLDIFAPEFVTRFARFARTTASVIHNESAESPYFSPVNEISFFSWAGAESGILPPFVKGRGRELKMQLVRANIAAIDSIRDLIPAARFVQVDPLIHIVTDPGMSAETVAEAHAYSRAQFEAWDMVCGRTAPELGGHPRYLDIVGGNYYVHNQWVYGGAFIERTDPRYRPLHHILADVWHRYNRPLFLAETGIEDNRRPEWLRYVSDEVVAALHNGTPVEGVCLYPVVNHPGWLDDRHCHNGLWDYCNDSGHREVYIPLAEELRRQQLRISDASALLLRNRELHVFA